MARIERTSLLHLLAIVGLMSFYGIDALHSQEQTDSVEASRLAEIAVNAQNNEDYQVAVRNWEKLITDHPDFSQIGKAEFNCGKCYMKLNDFAKAIAHLKIATQKLGDDAKVMMPESYLWLGYCQSEYGFSLLETNNEKARTLLTTSTQTFASQLKLFEDFEFNDQVAYFQGGAFEQLDRLEDAAGSYEKMFEINPDSSFQHQGMFALGNVYEQLGQYDKAMVRYQEYIKTGSDEQDYDEVRFRTAETLMQMADAAREIDDEDELNRNLLEARILYKDVAEIEGFTFRHDSQFQRAVCSHRLGELDVAASQFEVVASGQSNKAERAAALAGRDYVETGNMEKAEPHLRRVMDLDQDYATEAAHWMSQLHLRSGQAKQAFDLANDWIARNEADKRYIPELMQDQADAAFLLDDRRDESPELFMSLVNRFPEHRLAASALYNAAYAYLETALDDSEQSTNIDVTKLDKALQAAKDFEANYAKSTYLPDVLEVKADAHLLKKELDQSQVVYDRLVKDYSDNEKVGTWNVRAGMVNHLRDNHDEAIAWLSPLVDQLPSQSLKAEALHWTGVSQLAKEDYANAERSLSQSLDADSTWRLAAETMFALSQSQMKQEKTTEAEQTLTAMRTAFPKVPQVALADFNVAEMAYKARDFDKAIEKYTAIVADKSQLEFIPNCLSGIGWSQLQKKEFALGEAAFTDLIDQFPEHELAQQALLGRGMCRRQNEDAAAAVVDLEKFIKDLPDDPQHIEARYELALCQTNLKQNDKAMTSLTGLIKDASDHRFADRFYYELAWLHIDNEDAEKANEQFGIIAADLAESDLAPEANFQIGEFAYQAQEYEEAEQAFLRCRDSEGNDSLREKAAYRLGWCHYRQKQYDESHDVFAKQAEDFQNGKFRAEALVMIGESLYNQDKFPEAFDAYSVAKPAIDAAGNVAERNDWLTMLHGATAANRINRFQEAVDFLDPLLESDAGDEFKLDGWYEKGTALRGLNQVDGAKEAFTNAKASAGKTGARAYCMLGDMLFVEKKFDEAINEYKDVFYGFGGTRKDAEIDPWQAYAIYHSARCNFVQISNADEALKPRLISEAVKLYELLLADYGDDKFAEDAKNDLKVLKQLQNK